jgi:hypothetical protein
MIKFIEYIIAIGVIGRLRAIIGFFIILFEMA